MHNLNLRVAMMATALFSGVKHNAVHFLPYLEKIMSHTGKDLFGIYLTHALWLMLVNRPTLRDLLPHAISIPGISVLIFVLSLYTTKAIRLIPRLRKVVE